MASPSELSLEYKPHLNTYSMLLKSFGDHQQAADQTQRLEEVLARLEEERLKIEVFKRELPLCMQLLTNAVEASRQQLQASRSANQGPRPVLEEFIPLKNSAPEASDKCSNTYCDKANWMTSAQLWSQAAATDHIHATKPESTITSATHTPTPTYKENDASIGFNVLSPNLTLDPKPRNGGGGAFLPFSKEQQRNATLRSLSDLALASADKETDYQVKANKICTTGTENENSNNGIRESSSAAAAAAAKVVNNEQGKESNASITTTQTTHRKARRCWSPDLHRRFVNALQMLGGSQVATPKQIRELMKVDGLTNDEVKSHLQKFRLHTRRPSPSPQAVGAPATQLVVLGGIWVPPEYTTAAHNGAPPLYGASPASHPPPHFCAPVPPGPQDFYTAATPTTAPHHHYHHQQHQLHMYNATSQTNQSLPESDVRRAGELSESVEDGKSESSSWKGESGENGSGERRGLAALRVDGDASEITLKF